MQRNSKYIRIAIWVHHPEIIESSILLGKNNKWSVVSVFYPFKILSLEYCIFAGAMIYHIYDCLRLYI